MNFDWKFTDFLNGSAIDDEQIYDNRTQCVRLCPQGSLILTWIHDDVIKWKHFPRYWPFVRGIHRSPVNSPHKGQWRGALMFTLICVRINGWVNNREADDLRRYRGQYDVTVMSTLFSVRINNHMPSKNVFVITYPPKLCRWSLDWLIHLTLYDGCNYFSMLGIKLIHVSKMVKKEHKSNQILELILLYWKASLYIFIPDENTAIKTSVV